jgi:hypothetical protein
MKANELNSIFWDYLSVLSREWWEEVFRRTGPLSTKLTGIPSIGVDIVALLRWFEGITGEHDRQSVTHHLVMQDRERAGHED